MWKPIFSENNHEKDRISNTVHFISSELYSNTLQNDSSLLAGNAGISIFFGYLFSFNQNTLYQNICVKRIHDSLVSISEMPMTYTFSNGVAGIMWGFCHLVEIGILEKKSNDIISDEIDFFLIESAKINLKTGNYDYLHGGLGPVIYLLDRTNHKFVINSFSDILSALQNTSEKFKEGIAWRDLKEQKRKIYNLGLSHGLPSIIVLLSKLLQKDINSKVAKNLLENSIDWLLDKKNNSDYISQFPAFYPNDSSQYSRLAWCYGDLGIAAAILQAGLITGNQLWQEKAIIIALHASKRRSLEKNYIKDTCLCHGTAGIAHIFNRFYQYTHVEELKNAAEYWYIQTLNFFDTHNHFKMWSKDKEEGSFRWRRENGILEGISGVGLSLLASISNIEPKWDRCLLLS